MLEGERVLEQDLDHSTLFFSFTSFGPLLGRLGPDGIIRRAGPRLPVCNFFSFVLFAFFHFATFHQVPGCGLSLRAESG